MKCAVKPLDKSEYTRPLTDEQWKRLQAAFPSGVCDYSRPGIAQQVTRVSWQSY